MIIKESTQGNATSAISIAPLHNQPRQTLTGEAQSQQQGPAERQQRQAHAQVASAWSQPKQALTSEGSAQSQQQGPAQRQQRQAHAPVASAWGQPIQALTSEGSAQSQQQGPAQRQQRQAHAPVASAWSQPKQEPAHSQPATSESSFVLIIGKFITHLFPSAKPFQAIGKQTSAQISLRNQKELRLPSRTDKGTLGRPIELSANHFALKIQNQSIFHYDVHINPIPPKALFR